MKKVILPFLGMLILVLSGCKKESDDIEYGLNVAAIIGIESGQPIFITRDEILYAPDLLDYIYYNLLYEDDPVLASFSLNKSRQPADSKYRSVSILDIIPLGITSPGEEEGGDKGTIIPVDSMFCFDIVMYDRVNVLFAGLYHNSYYRNFAYEMTYDDLVYPDEEGATCLPILSIRAKPLGNEYSAKQIYRYPYAFNLYKYLYEILTPNSENKVTFGIRYSLGLDNDKVEYWEYLKDKDGEVGKFLITLE